MGRKITSTLDNAVLRYQAARHCDAVRRVALWYYSVRQNYYTKL